MRKVESTGFLLELELKTPKIQLKFLRNLPINVEKGLQINTMEIGKNISKINNIGLNNGIKQKNVATKNTQSMLAQTYAAYPSGQLLKAMFVGAKPIDEQKQNLDKLKNTSFAEKLEDYEFEALAGMMKKDNKNAKATNGLIGLIESGSVNMRTIYYSSKHSDIQPNMVNDIKLMQQAKATGMPVEDLIVPKFETADEAVKNAKVGDVYNVGDEKNVYIKTDDGNAKQLKFDKETYLKLFPPVERFSVGQSSIGDCYMVSTLDTLYQNPETRVKILDCFEQDGKDVKAKLPNREEVVVAKDCKLLEQMEDNPQEKIYIKGSEGLRILEHLYAGTRVDKAAQQAKNQTYNKLDDTVFEQLEYEDKQQFYTDTKQGSKDRIARSKAELAYLKKGGNIPEAAGFTREERIATLEKNIAEDKQSIRVSNKELRAQAPDTDEKMGRQLDRKEQLYETLKNPENFWAQVDESRFRVFDNDETGAYDTSYYDFVEDEVGIVLDGMKEKLQSENKSFQNVRALYREGGLAEEIFQVFDMPSYAVSTEDEDFESVVKEQIANGALFSATSNFEFENEDEMTQDYNIASGHAYGAKPYVDDNGDVRIVVVNPWNTTFGTDLSLKEFKNNYSCLIYAEK